jgi:hypothetical protein
MTSRSPHSIIQRAASGEEVANMIVYVCSPQASATTGAALRVDGGGVAPSPEGSARTHLARSNARQYAPIFARL